jgi:signal transduction histidine kinase
MAFKIHARTLLHLGSELISSDGVALYELIKNSIDAGSETVEVHITITMTHSNYLALIEYLMENKENQILSEAKERIFQFIEESAPNDKRAIFEDLISNSRNFKQLEAHLIRAYGDCNFISVVDRGHGMSLDDLNEIYLTIGTRSRRKEKDFLDQLNFDFETSKDPERGFLGDKGVGRLSTMRLGDFLEVETTQKNETYLNLLEIDWSRFGHGSDDMLGDIDIAPTKGRKKTKKSEQGTTVTVYELRSDWTNERIQEVIESDFARLVDPFEPRKANRLIKIFYNGNRRRMPEIPKRLLEEAHGWCEASFLRDEKTQKFKIQGRVAYPLRGDDWHRSIQVNETEILSLMHGSDDGKIPFLPASAFEKLGRFKVQFYWYNRRILSEIDGLGTAQDVRAEVRRWGGGLMVFRDGFRVNPYGGPDDDWLELDKKAFGAKGYKVNRNQIIGRVQITWRNRWLIDQTNREGFVDNAQKAALRRILQHILISEFRQFLDAVDDQFKIEEASDLDKLEAKIDKAKSEIEKLILRLMRDVPGHEAALSQLQTLTAELADYVKDAKLAAQNFEENRAKFVHLAGIGLMVEFILHELGRSSAHALNILRGVQSDKLPQSEKNLLNNLADQLKTLQKRIDNLDPLSTSRRQRKEEFDIFSVISGSVNSHGPEAERHQITLRGNFASGETWRISAVKGMFVQIIENLLSNAFYWLKEEKRADSGFKPALSIEIDPKGKSIIVSDNGPGIAPENKENVFQAFFTRKPAGAGKGLGLYICREIAEYHDWGLHLSEVANKKTGRLNTFILDLG